MASDPEARWPAKAGAESSVPRAPGEPARAKGASRTNGSARFPGTRFANWTVGLSAGVLLIISIGGYLYHRGQLADIAAEHLRLLVTGPARFQTGVPNRFTVDTSSITGAALQVPIEFALYSPDGGLLYTHKERTDEGGHLAVEVPSNVEVPSWLTLDVVGTHRGRSERVEVRLEVASPRALPRLSLDRSGYRVGETVRYRLLVVSRLRWTADRPLSVRFEVLDPRGKAVPGLAQEKSTATGVACGEFRIAQETRFPLGQYSLVAKSRDGSFPTARQAFWLSPGKDPGAVRPKSAAADGGTPPPPGKTISASQGTLHVMFCPEGGELTAGLEHRVYYSAFDSHGRPVRLRGRIVDSRDRSVAPFESTSEGLGTFSLEPVLGETYRLKIESPAGTKLEPRLPDVASHPVVLTTGLGVFEAGKPLEFNVRAAENGIPLVAAAACRGALVGQHALVTAGKSNPGAISLDDEVGGVVRLTLFDCRASPPKPVAERLVYRRPRHRLRIETFPTGRRYSAGQPVELTFRVTDESGKPTAAVLAIAVAPSSPSSWDLGNPRDWEAADFDLPEDPKAPAAVDLLLGTYGWRRLAEKPRQSLRNEGPQGQSPPASAILDEPPAPPAVCDNLSELQARFRDSLATYRANRTRGLNTLTTLSFFGGGGVILWVAMLSVMNIPCGIRLWIPSMLVAVTCLVSGAVLLNPERLKSGAEGSVPFVPHSGEAAAAQPDDGAKIVVREYPRWPEAVRDSHESERAETLYWNPQLATDREGRAAARFTLPQAAGTLKVLVDAHAEDGRIGSASTEIPVAPPAKQ